MFAFRGNTSIVVGNTPLNLPMVIENFLIVNKTAGAVTVNVYLIGTTTINLTPLNKSISAGESYESTRQTVMFATDVIRVQPSGSVDYDFTLSNLQAPLITEEQ